MKDTTSSSNSSKSPPWHERNWPLKNVTPRMEKMRKNRQHTAMTFKTSGIAENIAFLQCAVPVPASLRAASARARRATSPGLSVTRHLQSYYPTNKDNHEVKAVQLFCRYDLGCVADNKILKSISNVNKMVIIMSLICRNADCVDFGSSNGSSRARNNEDTMIRPRTI